MSLMYLAPRLFFNVLHPPLNVPALGEHGLVVLSLTLLMGYLLRGHTAVSLDEDVNTDKELVGHGISNLAAGLLGTVYVFVYRTLDETLTCPKTELSGLCQYALVSHIIFLRALPWYTDNDCETQVLSCRRGESCLWVYACYGHIFALGYRHLADRIHSCVQELFW